MRSLQPFRYEIYCTFFFRKPTCRLPALFPLPVAVVTADAGAVVSARVVDVAVECERDRTAVGRDCCRHDGTCVRTQQRNLHHY